MAKRKNTKELLAERNPLQRVFVEPVDIYNQEEAGDVVREERVSVNTSEKTPKASAPAAIKRASSEVDDPLRPYSTYLRRSQVKNIKRHAVEREVKDMLVVQEAIDEYLRRHKL